LWLSSFAKAAAAKSGSRTLCVLRKAKSGSGFTVCGFWFRVLGLRIDIAVAIASCAKASLAG
jgi:hypothetical protein